MAATTASELNEAGVKKRNLSTEDADVTSAGIDAEDDEDQAGSGTQTTKKRKKQERVPRRVCTCYYCEVDTGEDRTNQHICFVSGCNKVFRKPSVLRDHIRLHMGERPYKCSWDNCDKRFTRSDELRRHRLIHTGERNHECSECNKKFMRSDHLSKHMKIHHKQKCDHNDSGSNDSGTSDSNK